MWRVSYEPEVQRVTVHLSDQVTVADLRPASDNFARAMACAAHDHFSVLFDLRGLFPLDGDSVNVLRQLKSIAAGEPRAERLAVLTDSPTVSMQQARTHVETCFLSSDPDAVRQYLAITQASVVIEKY